MKLINFDYELPQELIAQDPLKKRDQARLMIVDRKSQTIKHDIFANVAKYLPENSHIILNNTKVIPARLIGQKTTGGKVEIFLLKKTSDAGVYEVLMKPMKRLKNDDTIWFEDSSLEARIVNKEKRLVQFNHDDIIDEAQRIGQLPLPPYIHRYDKEVDEEYYQTVYAKHAGSVASPTAGLHFTDELLTSLKSGGFDIDYVTLHVNYGTFKNVETENIEDHPMHAEEYQIDKNVFDKLKKTDKKVVAVGTTSNRVLEAVAQTGQLQGETNIFIYPGYTFKMVDILITNFHLPKSTLLMLVYAFGGQELMKRAYQEAIKEKYRFYSYGDAMIIV